MELYARDVAATGVASDHYLAPELAGGASGDVTRLLIADDDTLRGLLKQLVERDGRFELAAEAEDGRDR